MIRPLGPIVASPDVPAAAWAALPASRRPLVLAPSDASGWFGGRALVALDPVEVAATTLAEAGRALDAAHAGDEQALVVALLGYEGDAIVARYERGLVRGADGWRAWGDWGDEVPPEPGDLAAVDGPLLADERSDVSQADYCRGVFDVHEAIRRGDVYVLNLTYNLRGRPTCQAPTAFASLPAASMGAFWQLTDDRALASASPERFVRLGGGIVEVHPIKGTRPRGLSPAEDASLAAELAACEKERAEHVMIVDLERNDLGRVCSPGTVAVDPLMTVVQTPYAHQMVSRVCGLFREDATVGELLAAAFPCGSVTGAPKVSAMAHIARLEAAPRVAYTGSLVVALPGELDSSVLIRTMDVHGDEVVYGTGCGITIDSDPAEEWLESRLKAAPVLGDGAPPVALRETCRVVDGRAPLLEWHLGRLAAGGCGPTLIARVRAAAVQALKAWREPRGRLGITVTPYGEVDAAVDAHTSSLAVPGGPLGVLVPAPLPPLPQNAAKPADRSPWDRALISARPLGQQAILTHEGRIVDGSTANVWLRLGDRLVTPPAGPAIAGVARAVVLAHASELGLRAEVAQVTLEDFERAEEAFLTNALGGAVALRGRGGPAHKAVARLFARLWSAQWRRDPVPYTLLAK